MIGGLTRHRTWLIMTVLAIFSVAFHSYHLDFASYDLDEAVHIWHAQRSVADVIEQSSNDPNPPVYNLILSAWVKTFGVGESSVRFFSVLMGALGVALMFLIASRNFGLAVGIMAALFYCFSPIQFRFTHLARPYAMLMVTVLLSYGALFECLRDPKGRKLFWYFLASTLMIYVHPTSVFNLPAQGLIILLHHFKDLKQVFKLALPMIASLAAFACWVLAIPYFERNDTMWFDAPDFNAIWYVIKVLYGHAIIFYIQLILLFVLFVWLIRNKMSAQMVKLATLLLWVIVPFTISIVFSHLVKPVFQDKYILSVQPAMMLLLAFSTSLISWPAIRWAGLAALAGFLLVSVNMKPHPEGDWRSAAAYVSSIHDDNSIVLVDPWYEYRTFGFYFDRHAYEVPDSTIKILATERVFTNWNDVYDTLNHVPKTNVVHLMLAHEGFVVPQIPITEIEKIASLVAVKEFIGIRVLSYEFGRKLITADSIGLSFPNDQQISGSVTTKDEFSQAISLSLDRLERGKVLKITSSVKLRSNGKIDDVRFVTTVEKPDSPALVYRSKQISSADVINGHIELNETITLSDHGTDQFVKAYLWNVGKKEFEVDEMTLIIQH